METIIHKIRLLDGSKAEDFEDWVQKYDYTACPQLKSLLSFDVHRVPDSAEEQFHFFEVIKVSSREEFEQDMNTATFAGLVDAFSKMAEVVEEMEGTRIGTGFRAVKGE
jgi:hypothetical protein